MKPHSAEGKVNYRTVWPDSLLCYFLFFGALLLTVTAVLALLWSSRRRVPVFMDVLGVSEGLSVLQAATFGLNELFPPG